jgi:hypothetical protein
MSRPSAAAKPLDDDFLGVRCRLIELAAALDRVDRHGGALGDARMPAIQESLKILAGDGPHRAEQVQMAFSIRD